VTLKVITIYRIVNGKIVEVWEEADILGMMQQLGVIPPQ
jgi:predicted ester cyclase